MSTDPAPQPSPENPKSRAHLKRLTPEQRLEIARKLEAGVPVFKLVEEFGVSRQAIESYRKDAEGKIKTPRSLTTAERDNLKEILQRSMPADHGFTGPDVGNSGDWDYLVAHKMAEKVIGRKLFVNPFKELISEVFPVPSYAVRRPRKKVEEPMTVAEIEAYMARHHAEAAEALAKIKIARKAPTAWDLARIPGEDSPAMPPMDMWEFSDPKKLQEILKSRPDLAGPMPASHPMSAAQKPGSLVRTGKHKGSKGSPFTKPRRKKH